MFLKRLSAALVTITCLGYAALGAAPEALTNATNNGKENSVLAPLDLSPTLVSTPPRCTGESNGTITVTIVAGTGTSPFSYRVQKNGGIIQPPVSGNTSPFLINGLGAGNYTIYITDSSTPTPLTGQNSIAITNPPSLSLDLKNPNPVIYPKCTGDLATINFIASGGASPYNFDLSNDGSLWQSNTTGTFPGLPYGTYTAIVRDALGCAKNFDGSVIIDKLDPINISYSILSEINCEKGFASVKITALPTDPFTITVRNTTISKDYLVHSSDYIYSNLDAGSYIVTVSRNSCPANQGVINFNIAPFNDVVITPSPLSPVVLNCGGVNDLTDVQVTVGSVGQPTRQVHVVFDDNEPFTTDQQFTGLYGSTFDFEKIPAGNYTIRWNDVLNPTCTGSQPYNISNPASPLIWVNDPIGTKPLCDGASTGLITVNVSGGTIPRTIYVNGVVATTPINRAAGTYDVYVQDNKGCTTETKQVTIDPQVPLSLTHNPNDDVDVTCPGGNDGEIHITVSGGVGGYKYNLTGGTTPVSNVSTPGNIFINALSGGTYTVQVFDANNCDAGIISNIVIGEPTPIVIDQFELDTIQCFGDKASLNVRASGGGIPNMTYKLYSGASTIPINTKTSSGVATFNDLIPASYTLKIWSDLNCDALEKSFTVVDRKELVVVNESDPLMLSCPDQVPSFTLSISGEAPFSYSIDGSTVVDKPITGNSVVISAGLTSSTVGSLNRIVVKDKYGCLNEVFITIYEPTPIKTEDIVPTDVLCKTKRTGSISLIVSGGTPGYMLYLINPITLDTVKTYPAPTSGATVKIPALYAGTYNLLIKDKNGCDAPNPPTGIVVDEPDSLLKIEEPVFDAIKCFGATTDVYFEVSGGGAVNKTLKVTGEGRNMTIPSDSYFALKAGYYTITATNDDRCYAQPINLTIGQPTKLILNPPVVKNMSCNGMNDATISFSVEGGTPDYQYGLGGTGSAGISFAGTSYTINTGLVANLPYNLIVKDANDCPSTVFPITITEPAEVTFSIRQNHPDDSVKCYGGNEGRIVILNPQGGNLNGYQAYLTPLGGTEVERTMPITGLKAGSYSVRLSDNSTPGCFSEPQIVTFDEPDEINIIGVDSTDITCFGLSNGSISIDATGGLPYSLEYKITGYGYTRDPNFIGLKKGNYQVWVRSSNGYCEKPFTREVQVKEPSDIIVVKPLDITNVSCHNLNDGSVNIVASGGTGTLTYQLDVVPPGVSNTNTSGQWSGLGNDNTPTTTYDYIVKDINNCKDTGSFTIINPTLLEIVEKDHHQVYCNDKPTGWILVKASGGVGGYTYKNNFTNSDTIEFSKGEYSREEDSRIKMLKLTGGNYIPEVIDGNGCTAQIPGAINIVNPPPLKIANVIPGEKRCFDSEDDSTIIILDAADYGTRGTYKYTVNNWVKTIPTKELQCTFVNLRDTMIYAMVMDTMGCVATYEQKVLTWPDAFNVEIIQRPITCWDNQYGSLITNFKGGTMPYLVSVDDIAFGNPVIIDLDVPGAVVTDTIKGNPQNRFFYEGVRTDIYVKDANNCVAMNVPSTNNMNPFFYKDYIWDAVDTFEVTDIISTPPGCSYIEANLQIITNDKGEKNYTYWAQYYDSGTNKNITADSTSNSRLDVPADRIIKWYVADKNSCQPLVGVKVDPLQNQEIYIPATADTIEVSFKINDDERPECPYTKDGVVRINVKGFSSQGVRVNIYETDSTYLNYNPFRPKHTSFIYASERDTFYWYEKVNILTGDLVYSDTLFVVTNDSIKFLFPVGYYYVEFTDSQSQCTVSEQFEILPQDTICPDVYDLLFTPNGDKVNDSWILNDLDLENATLKIFNSEGELVYHFPKGGLGFASGGLKWDGLDDKGRPVPAGTYMYVYMMNAVKTKVKYGNITLLRGRN